MSVLIVPSWYTPGSNKQLGSFFREQAMAIMHVGKDVIIADATLQGHDKIFDKNNFHLKNFSDEGLDTYTYTMPAFGLGKVPCLFEKVFYRNLKTIFKHILRDGKKVDVIHAHSYYPAGYAAVLLGSEYGIPVIITEHASGILSKNLKGFQKKILKSCVDRAEKFICVSNALKESIIEHTNTTKEIYVIPNMVDNKFVPSLTESKDNNFYYVSIGNLIHRKRFDLTLKSFSMCFKGQEHIRLKIIGDGVLANKLRNFANELGISSQVFFTGRLSREEVLHELQNSNVFVLPSDYETFGVVYIEAMACGIPVIGTKNGGADDIITSMDGYLINVDSLEELKEAMQLSYKFYHTFDKKQIADKCQKRFGEKTISRKIQDIYNQLI